RSRPLRRAGISGCAREPFRRVPAASAGGRYRAAPRHPERYPAPRDPPTPPESWPWPRGSPPDEGVADWVRPLLAPRARAAVRGDRQRREHVPVEVLRVSQRKAVPAVALGHLRQSTNMAGDGKGTEPEVNHAVAGAPPR